MGRESRRGRKYRFYGADSTEPVSCSPVTNGDDPCGWLGESWVEVIFYPYRGVCCASPMSPRADRIFAKAVDHQWSRNGVSCSRHEWLSRQQLSQLPNRYCGSASARARRRLQRTAVLRAAI